MKIPYCKDCPFEDVKEEYAMVGSEYKCVKAACRHEDACSYVVECVSKSSKSEARKASPKPAASASKPKSKAAVKSKKA